MTRSRFWKGSLYTHDWAHNDMEMEIEKKHNVSRPLLQKAYSIYDHVIPVGEDIRGAAERIGGHPEKIQVISNYMDVESICSKSQKPLVFDENTESTVPVEKDAPGNPGQQ